MEWRNLTKKESCWSVSDDPAQEVIARAYWQIKSNRSNINKPSDGEEVRVNRSQGVEPLVITLWPRKAWGELH